LVGHTKKKLHCDCWNPSTDEGDINCKKCFGTGWNYNWYLTKTRRAEASMIRDQLDLSEEIKLHTTTYDYFFKVEVNIKTYDFIFEIDNIRNPNNIDQIIVTNDVPKHGRYNNGTYKKVLANKIFVNSQDLVNQGVKDILNQELERV